MHRSALQVRPATEADLPAMLALADELRDTLVLSLDPTSRPRSATAAAVLEQRYRDAISSSDRHLVLVVDDGDQPLGAALFTVGPANPLLDVPAVHMSHAFVADRHKRRGAGKALVAAAAAFAEERGIDQLVVSVRPSAREANRFFARLGFAPLAVRRVAPVAVVRRRLAAPGLGRRTPAPALPLGPADAESTGDAESIGDAETRRGDDAER